jgi:hypothetical protein
MHIELGRCLADVLAVVTEEDGSALPWRLRKEDGGDGDEISARQLLLSLSRVMHHG